MNNDDDMSAGTREDAAADKLRNCVPINVNSVPTSGERPKTPAENRHLRGLPDGVHSTVGSPNADTPPVISFIGMPSTNGVDQPPEGKAVSASNASPRPARFFDQPIEAGFQRQATLKSRAEIHRIEQGVGIASTPMGGDAVSAPERAGAAPKEKRVAE